MVSKRARFARFAAALESAGGGVPRIALTAKQAKQFIFPNGMILRFDLVLGQYSPQQGPHINLQVSAGRNHHIYLERDARVSSARGPR
jgi:hypothetical protein